MEPQHIFLIVWLVAAVILLSVFIINGKKALEIYPDIKDVNVRFQEKNVSGYSNRTTLFRKGGGSRVIDVILTDEELWVRTNLLLAFSAERFDLMHKLPFKNIKSIRIEKRKTFIVIQPEHGNEFELTLKLSKSESFYNTFNELKNSQIST